MNSPELHALGVEGRLRGKGWVGRSGGLFRSNFWLLCSLHQEREERRGEMEFVPKARYEDCGEERDDDL